MKRFILIYHYDDEAKAAMATLKKEEQQASMIAWHTWRDGLGEKLVDFGGILFGGTNLYADKEEPCTKNILGYSFIQADDLEDAKTLIANHPHLKWHRGAQIEVHEYMSI